MYDELSVIFENPATDPLGMSHVSGKVYCGREHLELQFKLKDRAFRKSESQTVRFDYAEIEKAEFMTGWFRPKILVFQTRSPDKLDGFPGSQVGRIELLVSGGSVAEARKVSELIRFKQSEAFLAESEARLNRLREDEA
ncbi:MAG: hypothetical protein ABL994_02355 [Verrucomicrobiales bacterium]